MKAIIVEAIRRLSQWKKDALSKRVFGPSPPPGLTRMEKSQRREANGSKLKSRNSQLRVDVPRRIFSLQTFHHA